MTPYMTAMGRMLSGKFMRLMSEIVTKAVSASSTFVGSIRTNVVKFISATYNSDDLQQ